MLLILLISACTQTTDRGNIPIISFEDCSESVDLKISDIAKDFRFVKLQTDSTCYINGGAEFIISKKHIITYDMTRMLQFSSDGKFIRCLTKRGRGPNEYLFITYYHLSNSEKYLYFKTGASGLKKINLETGEFEKEIKLSLKPYTSQEFINDSTLVVSSSNSLKGKKDSLIIQDLNSNIIRNTPVIEKRKDYFPFRNVFFKKNNNVFTYNQPIYGDTIYQISRKNNSPYFIVNGVNQYSVNKESKGIRSEITSFTKNFCIFSNSPITVKKLNEKQYMPTINTRESKYFYLSFPDFKLQQISSIHNEFSQNKHTDNIIHLLCSNSNYTKITNNKIYYKMEPVDILENIKNKSELRFPKKYHAQYMNIAENLSENDNPVLLIGNIK